ncbi:hypothetical protein VSQ48_07260 [Candidatus Ventrimonas sp. KK005]
MNDEERLMVVLNTVAVIEAGIGAMSLGFVEAGFQVTDVFIKESSGDL